MEAEETDPLIERTEPPDRRSRFARVKGHMRSSMRSGFAFWTQRASAWRGALFRRRMEQLPELEEPLARVNDSVPASEEGFKECSTKLSVT